MFENSLEFFKSFSIYRTYSIVALRAFVLAFLSIELMPKRIVFIKTDSEKSRRLLLIFSAVLRRALPSVIYVGQWAVDPISKSQLQKGFKEFWKL